MEKHNLIPPFDSVNLDCRIAALEIILSLIIKSLSPADRTALSHYADLELDRIKQDVSFERYPDLAQTIKDCYLSETTPLREPNIED
ncbi:Uncharacterised protein [Edwardsiella tarda]|uniref:Uncharacterized protein n=1 Tax=Edwardsiella tarda ATCC 15947 = NBRC 105688 TaxID=667121 RepID=A0AC61TLS2_EDWTA|nr:hypothetical protein [Edwardsiella tarda]UAL55321.1 hypothetical protein K8O98_10750 [Edwardsiella tarda]UCQ01636.1 hypothetical protein DCL27_07755 [Edwardsiella tarda ATCC 15947 = NBRC 105688]STD29344.1 Uncharacterised protein [Edwardsiella tarda]